MGPLSEGVLQDRIRLLLVKGNVIFRLYLVLMRPYAALLVNVKEFERDDFSKSG